MTDDYSSLPPATGYCLECGDEIPYGGRKGRKFCSDLCRNHYHNDRRNDVRFLHQRIDSALQRNYRILSRISEIGITQAACEDLAILGFQREMMTSCRAHSHFLECRCYEFSYRLSPRRIFQIKKIPVEYLSKETPPESAKKEKRPMQLSSVSSADL